MFDVDKHKMVMLRILKDIYSDNKLMSFLGFKGGTMAYLFYDLPRFSVDLDFDLLDKNKEGTVFEELGVVVGRYGKLLESVVKKNTLFFLVDYGFEERKLKIEVTRCKTETDFVVMNYLGISMLTMNQGAMVASKLWALVNRKKMANRDVFDIYYFLKNNWEMDEKLLKKLSGFKVKEVIEMAIARIGKIKKNEILFGLGDLLDNSTKEKVKKDLIRDVLLELEMRKDRKIV